jgi:hypothetical protein
MTNKTKVFRHGEILFCQIEKLPKGLKETKSKVFATGSHGNSHTFDNGKLYLKQDGDYIFGYFVAKDTNLFHPEHSPKIGDAKLPDGIYELRRQQEFVNSELTPVID